MMRYKMIGNYKVLSEKDMKKMRDDAKYCDLTGKPINKPIIDHLHEFEHTLGNVSDDATGKVRGVISNSSNLALGFIMKECRELDMNINDYLDKVKEYVNRAPSDFIYPKHLSDIRKKFESLTTVDKQDYLEYHFGVETMSTNDITLAKQLNDAIQDKYYG